jgi:hypothetical protein
MDALWRRLSLQPICKSVTKVEHQAIALHKIDALKKRDKK